MEPVKGLEPRPDNYKFFPVKTHRMSLSVMRLYLLAFPKYASTWWHSRYAEGCYISRYIGT